MSNLPKSSYLGTAFSSWAPMLLNLEANMDPSGKAEGQVLFYAINKWRITSAATQQIMTKGGPTLEYEQFEFQGHRGILYEFEVEQEANNVWVSGPESWIFSFDRETGVLIRAS